MNVHLAFKLSLIIVLLSDKIFAQDSDEGKCEPKPCKCTRERSPVCGTNGKTYANRCLLKCDRQCNKDLEIQSEGSCQKKSAKKTSAKSNDGECKADPCVCGRDYRPVCGTNNRSYSNKCLLDCYRKQCDSSLSVQHQGTCEESEEKSPKNSKKSQVCEPKPCPCTREYKPLCGTDRRTYSNPCLMRCNKNQCNKSLKKAYNGPCESNRSPKSRKKAKCQRKRACRCMSEEKPVCGTNGRTYRNRCLLSCDTDCNPGLKVAYEGRCATKKRSKESGTANSTGPTACKRKRACRCTKDYRPVCGTDQRTYGNPCMLRCDQECNPNLKAAHKGECEREDDNSNSNSKSATNSSCQDCGCSAEYKPVCASNNKTYTSRCHLRCDMRCSRNLREKRRGECETAKSSRKENKSCSGDCVCTANYQPVCGSNGRTYSNRCRLSCDQQCNQSVSEAYEGVCRDSRSSTNNNTCSRNCMCTEEYNPVCGTNGRTYSNPCHFRCEQRCNRKLKQSHEGECEKQSSKGKKKKSGCNQRCACPLSYFPVCGSDGKTYSNECSLRCAKRCKRRLRQKSQGKCGKSRRRKSKTRKTRKPRTTTPETVEYEE